MTIVFKWTIKWIQKCKHHPPSLTAVSFVHECFKLDSVHVVKSTANKQLWQTCEIIEWSFSSDTCSCCDYESSSLCLIITACDCDWVFLIWQCLRINGRKRISGLCWCLCLKICPSSVTFSDILTTLSLWLTNRSASKYELFSGSKSLTGINLTVGKLLCRLTAPLFVSMSWTNVNKIWMGNWRKWRSIDFESSLMCHANQTLQF